MYWGTNITHGLNSGKLAVCIGVQILLVSLVLESELCLYWGSLVALVLRSELCVYWGAEITGCPSPEIKLCVY